MRGITAEWGRTHVANLGTSRAPPGRHVRIVSAAREGQELLHRHAGHVSGHAVRLRAPFWVSAALDIAASNTVAVSYSSCRFHHPYGAVCG
jgi:hypothetical protein